MIWVVGFACPLLLASCKNKAVEETAPVYPVVSVAVSSVEMTDDFPATIQGRQESPFIRKCRGPSRRSASMKGKKSVRGSCFS